jgi:iron complex outermembrane recepter protein
MRKIYLHIVLSSVIIVFANTISYSQNGVITGKVKYGTEVLRSATVSLGDQTTYTDHKGDFSISIKPGNYTITVTHVSYNKIEQAVRVEAGSTQNIDFVMIPNEQLGEVTVFGSRSPVHRSNLNTAVPVDVFSSAELAQTGQTNLMQMLNFTAPSFNASMQIMTEPVTLRGLDPDHTLILLNGTRYHNIAYMNPGLPRGQLGRGSVGNDLNTIPFSAIEKVEILRDGASAQYGSDAIAGVINTRLKESTGKTSVSLHLGENYKRDGEKFKLGIYRGFDLKKGFLSFSADLNHREPAFRGGEYKGTVYYPTTQNASIIALDNQKIAESGFDRMKAGNAGNTKSTSFGFLMNGAYRVHSKMELFWTATLNYQALTFKGNHILPKNAASINRLLFPDGFKAIAKPVTWNVSGIAGARGIIGKGIHWEYSTAFGMNSIRYNAENTNNASQEYTLGKKAPTSFYTGSVIYHQLTNTIHFTKNINNSGDKSTIINLAWGGELRFENFGMKAGEEASWENYDSLHTKMVGVTAPHIVSGEDALNKNRGVMCGYADIEADLNDRFLLNLATRYEYYSDFGGNLAGKMAIRYKLFNKLFLRGSLSNGFRAPSIQQRYYNAITNGIRGMGGVQTPTSRRIFNNEHHVTKVFGVPSLEAEKSINLSGGLTSTISRHIYLTIDAYWIQIRNRIVLSGAFDRASNPEVDSLLKSSSPDGYPDVHQVSFFSNSINTRTKGIDIVLHGKWKIRKAQLIGSLAANFTKTRLFGEIKTVPNLSASTANKNSLFDDEQRSDVERGQPRSKIILSLNYQREKIGFILRNTRFGENAYDYSDMGSIIRPLETFSPKILTDVSICYTPRSWFSITVGANNIFNVYPDRIKNFGSTGEGRSIYSVDVSQFGYMGGYYYISMGLNF